MPVLDVLLISLLIALFGLCIRAIIVYTSKKKWFFRNEWLVLVILTVVFTIVSFVKVERDIGGTLLHEVHGWPHYYYTFAIEDVIDKVYVGMGQFVLGPFGIYIIVNIIFYFASLYLLCSGYYIIKIVKEKRYGKKME